MIIDPKEIKKPLSHYFLKGEALSRFYSLATTGVGLVNSFFIITYLSVFHFGLYQLLLAFIGILGSFNVGLLDSIVGVDIRRYLNVGKLDFAKRLFLENAAVKIAFAILLTVTVFLGANLIADYYGEDIALFIKIAGALILIRALETVEATFLKSVFSFAHWSFPAIREIVKLILILSFIFFHRFTILEVMIAHVSSEAASLLFITLYVFAGKYRKAFGAVKAVKEILLLNIVKVYGKWTFLRYGFSKISKNLMPWFIKFFVNTEAVAFYSLALNIVAFIENLLPLSGLGPIFLLKADRKDELAFIFRSSAKYTVWAGLAALVVAFLLVPPAVAFIFPKYTPAIPLFNIMILAMPVYGLYKVLKSILSVLREHQLLAMRILNEILVIFFGSLILLPIFGVLGAGMVYVATYLERVWFFYSRMIKKYPDFKFKIKNLFKFSEEDKDLMRRIIRQSLSLFFKPQNKS